MNIEEIWQAALSELEVEVSRANFNTWLRNTKALNKEDGLFFIAVPDSFTKEWLENKYYDKVLVILKNLSRDIHGIKYEIKTDVFKLNNISSAHINRSTPLSVQLNFNSNSNNIIRAGLNSKYLFENFIVGPFNQLAHAAATAVVKNPGRHFNPLFIYGTVGIGKTHLIQAIGNEILKNSPEKKVKYITSDRFLDNLITSIKTGSVDMFKENYYKTDVLIIDDVQFFTGKEKMQEIFFHTFNYLYQNNKQIILSSDRSPAVIDNIPNRLKSRFEGGMIADINMPDFETKMAILEKKLEYKKYNLNKKIIIRVAEKVGTIRELEGVLNTIISYLELNGLIQQSQVDEIISKLSISSKKITTFDKILKIITDSYNIKEDLLLKAIRIKEVVHPRQVLIYLLRNELDYSFSSIGKKLGGKDHSTIMYACKKIEEKYRDSMDFKRELDIIKDKIYY
ncbi:MAG: Chromosomal replication initiator protein DnaA [Parcubacteria group bacterium GW2011_GWA2_31_28]|nr:MAG: Chromosomal replication initiator protein DnaA [Parcubacteria group bacterium GW2011_GWA2_31_28]